MRINLQNLLANSDTNSTEQKRVKTSVKWNTTARGHDLIDEDNSVKIQAFIEIIEAKKTKHIQQKIQFTRK